MEVIKDKKSIVTFDVDETLIMWNKDSEDTVEVTLEGEDGFTEVFTPHREHIKMLKDFKKVCRYTVVVWSQSGWDWALAVVKALDLEKHVDVVMSKPSRHVDDLPSELWMGQRIYKEFSSEDVSQ